MVFGLKVDDAQTSALQNAEPLFDWIHPRAMHGCEVEGESGMVSCPLPLSLPFITLPIDLARTGVKGGQEISGARARILVLMSVGKVLRLGWQGWGATRALLQGGLLVHRQHQFIRMQRPRVEVNQLRHGGVEGGIPQLFGIPPDMLPPGFQLMRGQNLAHRGDGDCSAIRRQLTY